jgi:dolichol-phosphate mannosyltransferase
MLFLRYRSGAGGAILPPVCFYGKKTIVSIVTRSPDDAASPDGAGDFGPGGEMRLSVVVPVFNEAENVEPLLAEIEAALRGRFDYEILFVDDCSSDDTLARLAPAVAAGRLRVMRHLQRCGQSAAVRTGVKAARNPWIATLDGDGQNDPADIPTLAAAVTTAPESARPALVGGLRLSRRDTLSKRLASRFANAVRQAFLDDGCIDSGCGAKLFRRDAFLDLPFFGAIHRFLPALFRAHGHKTAFVAVNHRPRGRGVSKYTNLRRGLIGVVDLLGVYWLKRRTQLSPAAEVRSNTN